jgi:hypothetical protein
VESLTALVEDHDGKWQIVHYADWVAAHDGSSIVKSLPSSLDLLDRKTELYAAV